jgi:hypothetical protein
MNINSQLFQRAMQDAIMRHLNVEVAKSYGYIPDVDAWLSDYNKLVKRLPPPWVMLKAEMCNSSLAPEPPAQPPEQPAE